MNQSFLYGFLLVTFITVAFYLINRFKNVENFKEEENKRMEEKDKKKVVFSIIVDPKKMKNLNKHIKGFGSQTSLNVYKVDYIK